MADEIEDQNVVKTFRDPSTGLWTARIGPDAGPNVETVAADALGALTELLAILHSGGYLFDFTWTPR